MAEQRPTSEAIDVDYVAQLARVELSDAEREQFQQQISDIVGYVRKLQELDVSDVEPTAHATTIVNVVADDVPAPGMSRAATLANAPEVLDEELIQVPVVIGADAGGSA